MAAGTTLGRYYEKRKLNSFGYDPIDQIVITAARSLDSRYIPVFGLLYECHSITEIVGRLKEERSIILSELTVRKYMRDSKTRMIELVTKDDTIISGIKRTIESEK